MTFDIGLILSHLPSVLGGVGMTLLIWAISCSGGIVLGFVVALLRHYGPLPVSAGLRVVVEVLRGSPFLVQLFLLYYGGPFIHISLDPMPAGILGLTIYGAAYFSEIYRTGFEAVPIGHIQAAECVGLSRLQIIRRIIIPEMTMLVLPATVNMIVLLLKETATLSIITVPELTMIVSAIGSEFYAFVEAMFLLALFYWGMVEVCGVLGRFAEARLSKFRFAQP